jgi:hypothetical protein
VTAAISRLGSPALDEMLPVVYDDVHPRVHPVAARSLTAHLEKLVAEGKVRAKDGRFSLA